jgi:hypothetical protein
MGERILTMKEKPMLFTASSVRSILAGTKTQTRRLKGKYEVGQHLWVRETYYPLNETTFSYAATYTERMLENWKPPLYMPRHASRITLEVTSVRVERLQDISEADAMAEGICEPSFNDKEQEVFPYKAAYAALWEKINSKGSWCSNPNVFVITFKRIKP